MNVRRTLWIVVLSLLSILTTGAVLAAPPDVPSSFYGQVKVFGDNVPADTVVSATIGGVTCGQATVQEDAESGSVYALNVLADDPDTAEVEGGREGEAIIFVITFPDGNRYTATPKGVWHGGTEVQLNLTQQPMIALPLLVAGS